MKREKERRKCGGEGKSIRDGKGIEGRRDGDESTSETWIYRTTKAKLG